MDLFLLPAPGDASSVFNLTGIGGQFDNTSPFDGGYQLLPRFESDFDIITSTHNVLASQIEIFPNPTSDVLNVKSDVDLDAIQIVDVLGRLIIDREVSSGRIDIDVSQLEAGLYHVRCIKDDAQLTMYLVVQ